MTTHQIILLDMSGSMAPCRDATISSFNELVQDVARRASTGGDPVTVTLVTFGSEVAFVKFCEPVDALTPLTEQSYAPDGMTALHDAIGAALHRFKLQVPDAPGDRYLVALVTDGQENASRHYQAEEVARMIARRRGTGRWTFSLLGANQDLRETARRLAISLEQVVPYEASPVGTIGGWKRLGSTMVYSVSAILDASGSDPGRRGAN